MFDTDFTITFAPTTYIMTTLAALTLVNGGL